MDEDIKKHANENFELLLNDASIVNIQAVLADKTIPKIYGNGFAFGFSLADASIVIQHGPTPVALLTVSFTSLKTLSEALNEVVANLEKDLGEPLKSIQSIKKDFKNNPTKK